MSGTKRDPLPLRIELRRLCARARAALAGRVEDPEAVEAWLVHLDRRREEREREARRRAAREWYERNRRPLDGQKVRALCGVR